MRVLYLSDASGKDTHVGFVGLKAKSGSQRAYGGRPVSMKRFLVSGESSNHDDLVRAHGEDYGQALIDGDPEIDLRVLGKPIDSTQTLFLSADGSPMSVAPRLIEVLYEPSGDERTRREPVDTPANVGGETPIRISKKRLKRKEAVRRFVFSRHVQLQHVDGLTFQFLHGLAKELHDADEMAMVTAGESGKEPLVLQQNGVPWRAFLEGRVDGDAYALLMHLSNMELKVPESLNG